MDIDLQIITKPYLIKTINLCLVAKLQYNYKCASMRLCLGENAIFTAPN